MENIKKLSIIIPVYNVENYLQQCLESVINNYRKELEIILINDGSTDNSFNICEDYGKRYNFIKLINRKNGGLSVARNDGIKASGGKYIWFVDSDDFIENDSVDLIYEEIEKKKDVILINNRNIYPNGEIEDIIDFRVKEDINIESYEYLYSLGNISYGATRFIVRRDFILDKGILFTEGIYHEDEDWTPRVICEARSFTSIIKPLYNYRVGNPTSIIGMKNYKKIKDRIYICNKFYDICKNGKLDDKKIEFIISRIINNYVVGLNECSLYDKKKREELVTLLKENKKLLRLSNNKKSILVRLSMSIIGVVNTSKLLRLRNSI